MRSRILKITSPEKQPREIEKALQVLKKGGILCLPTDTVYGLAVDAYNERAVDKLYQLKKRAEEKPLILFPKDHKIIVHLVKYFSPSALALISNFWPGPLTLIFEASIKKPRCLVSKEGKIGVRMPSHPVPRIISQKDNLFLATTSANISGEKSAVEVQNLSPVIKEGVDLILDSGPAFFGKESTIVDITTVPPHIIREGKIRQDEIKRVCEKGLNILFVCTANMCRSVMAEAIFKNLWPGDSPYKVNVRSAGINTVPSSPPSRFTVAVMKKRGIDIRSHLSTPLTDELINKSDVIFVMERGHRDYLVKLYPGAQNKIWLLKEFSRGKEEEVFDPAGASEEFHQEKARELEKEIEKIVEKMGEK